MKRLGDFERALKKSPPQPPLMTAATTMRAGTTDVTIGATTDSSLAVATIMGAVATIVIIATAVIIRGRYRDNGTGGTIIGGIAGALPGQ